MKEKVFEIKVPDGQAGRVWSLSLLDVKDEAVWANFKIDPKDQKVNKGFVQFWLEGVPPVVASSPAQLLIAKGDE